MLYNNNFISRLDKFFAEYYVRLWGERTGCLSAFLFHGLFRDQKECRNEIVDIQQCITVKHFEAFIEYFLDQGYLFVGQNDILKGLDPQKNHVLITFDDGYYNNTYAVDILKKFQVPAIFFISTSYILEQKAFWWDVIARERGKQGASREKISREQNFLKTKKSAELENYLIDQFGPNALKTIGDVDRPLTVAELKNLSRQPFVEIGNHTSGHAILTNYSYDAAKDEMRQAQNHLQEITGSRPIAVAYPNGNFSDEIIAAAQDVGFKIGITTLEGKNYLPLPNGELFCLKRFTLWGDGRFVGECDRTRSDFQLKSSLKELLGKVKK